jgi:hypothetical protein
MQPPKKKDNLTDLVDVATAPSASPSNTPLKDGEAITPTGEIVTMGTEAEDRELTNLARKLIIWSKAKQKARKITIAKAVEKHLKQPPHTGE